MQFLILIDVDEDFFDKEGYDGVLNKIRRIPEFTIEDWDTTFYNDESKFVVSHGTITETYDD